MKKLRSLSRLACAFAFCLLALCLLPTTAHAECDHSNLTHMDVRWEHSTVDYNEAECYCVACNQLLGTVRVTAQNAVYDGNPHGGELTYTSNLIPQCTIYYEKGGNRLDGAPTEAYAYPYEACFSVGGYTHPTTFRIYPASPEFTIAPQAAQNLVYTGSAQNLLQELAASELGTVVYSVGSGSYAEQMPAAANAGTYTVNCKIKQTSGATDNYETTEVTVKIGKASLENAQIVLQADTERYTGAAHDPTYLVRWNNKVLVKDTDYTAKWTEDMTNAGTKTLTITGKGNFEGQITATYTITSVDAPDITFPEAVNSITYGDNCIQDAGLTVTSNELGTFQWLNATTTPTRADDNYPSVILFKPNHPENHKWAEKYGNDWLEDEKAVRHSTVIKVKKGNPQLFIMQGQRKTYDGAPVTADTVNADIIYDFRCDSNNATAVVEWYTDENYQPGEKISAPVGAGTYWIKVVTPDGNYKYAEEFAYFIIQKAALPITAPSILEPHVYKGEEQPLIRAGESSKGTFYYALGTDGTTAPTDGWSTAVPKAINAGSYHVWYRATPNDTVNYEIIKATYVGKAVVAPAPTPKIVFPIVEVGITYGQPLKDVALTDTSNAFGTFAWAEPELILDAGEARVALDFTPNALSLQNYNWENPGEGITWIQEENVLRQRVIVPIYKAQSKIETAPTPITGMIYNGEERALVNAGTAVGGIVAYNLSVDGNGGYEAVIPVVKNAGNYTVWYKVIGDSNHTDSQIARVDIQISKADPVIGAVTAATVKDTTDLSAVVLTRANETIAGTLMVDAGQTLALGTNTVTYTFTPVDAVNYITVTGFTGVTVVDTIPPTGEVTLSTNSWKEFLNNITFGKFFKETQTLKVTAADSFSGVAKVEYAESSKALDLAAVQAITDWKQMDGSVSVTAEDAKRFVYYVRITDKSGNVTYLSSDGAEFDTSAPVITGISEGVTYHTTQTVTVTDKNLDTVTLNGKTVTAPVSLPGNKEATYTVTATDKAGNTATITVKMAPIVQISGDVADKTTQTVTTADAEKLEQILAETEELLEDETLPAEEKAALEKTQADAQALLNQVEASLEAVRTEAVENTLDTTADNVQLSQKEEIQEAIETIETALETYATNYTADDKQQMQAQLDQLKAAATAIENVENVQKSVSQLPAAVEPDDEAAEEKILAAKAAYDAMTEYEKTLTKAEGEKLTALLTALTDYRIVKGNGAVFNGNSLTFTANGAYKKFKGLLVNGITVDPKYYTAKSGSTIITLSEDYLKTLKGGTHTITVLYTDGETSGTFSVTKQAAAKPNVPDTGDHAAPLLWTLISIGTLSAALLLADRKRRYVK